MAYRRDRVRRGFFEVVIITVSILLAFTLDRWWERRIESNTELEVLASLVSEFQATSAELRKAWLAHEERRAAATVLAASAPGDLEQWGADSVRVLWTRAGSPRFSDPPTGALESTIASGDIRFIRNRELRALLAGWNDQLRDMGHTEGIISEYIRNVFIPDLSQRALLPRLNAPVTAALITELRTVSAQNHLNYLAVYSGVVTRENEVLQAAVEDILAMLREGAGA